MSHIMPNFSVTHTDSSGKQHVTNHGSVTFSRPDSNNRGTWTIHTRHHGDEPSASYQLTGTTISSTGLNFKLTDDGTNSEITYSGLNGTVTLTNGEITGGSGNLTISGTSDSAETNATDSWSASGSTGDELELEPHKRHHHEHHHHHEAKA